jgi:hypothetical protein
MARDSARVGHLAATIPPPPDQLARVEEAQRIEGLFHLTLIKLLILASEGRVDLRFRWLSRLDLRTNLIS